MPAWAVNAPWPDIRGLTVVFVGFIEVLVRYGPPKLNPQTPLGPHLPFFLPSGVGGQSASTLHTATHCLPSPGMSRHPHVFVLSMHLPFPWQSLSALHLTAGLPPPDELELDEPEPPDEPDPPDEPEPLDDPPPPGTQ